MIIGFLIFVVLGGILWSDVRTDKRQDMWIGNIIVKSSEKGNSEIS